MSSKFNIIGHFRLVSQAEHQCPPSSFFRSPILNMELISVILETGGGGGGRGTPFNGLYEEVTDTNP